MTQWWERTTDQPAPALPQFRAVAYYRHSAQDRQENSIPIQRDQVREWASKNGVEIIHEFADAGKSGLAAAAGDEQGIFDLSGQLRIARGQHTTVAASDTVVTGLAKVVTAVAALDSDPADDPMLASVSIGDQAGAPAAGSILVKTWKNTGGTDPTPAAATTFSKKVNWIAVGI